MKDLRLTLVARLLVATTVLGPVAPASATEVKPAEAGRTASGKVLTAKSPVSGLQKPAKPAPKDSKTTTPPEEETEHVVREGETLGGIANRARVPRVLIIEANKLTPPYAVRMGQKLVLPRTRQHVVKAGETGFDIAYQYGVPFSAIAVANGLSADARVKQGQKLLIPTVLKPKTETGKTEAGKAEAGKAEDTASGKPSPQDGKILAAPRLMWPLEGKVRRGYTSRSKTDENGDYHDGLDIPAEQGTAARAVAGGTVIFAGYEPESFGNLVVLDHGNGWQSAYGFLSKVTVKKGNAVTAHERVGLVGHSGKAGRDELHFELRHANQPVDPTPYLPKIKKVERKPASAQMAESGKRAKAVN